MVLSFFKGSSSEGSFEHIVNHSISMLADARHSFDLATLVLLTDADPVAVAQDIRETDDRINRAEHDLRSELVVHVSVQGSSDIASVLGFTVLVKKIERIGDQAKNLLELAEHGVTLAGRPDTDRLLAERQIMSELFSQAGELLADPDLTEQDARGFTAQCEQLMSAHRQVVRDCLTSDRPGREVVPVAMYYRYLRRIVANLLGVVKSAIDPLPPPGEGEVDIDD